MERRLGTILGQVARIMRRSFDQRARKIGITRPQWQVIYFLWRHEGIRQGELAEMLEVEPITAGRMIDRMQDAGLVERRADPSDRRAWRLFLTGRGLSLVGQLEPLSEEISDLALAGVSASEQTQLFETLEKIRLNLTGKPIATTHDMQ